MTSDNKKYFLHKLLCNELTEDEKISLFNSYDVVHRMEQQWEKSAEMASDDLPNDRDMYKNIHKRISRIDSGYYNRKTVFYKIYSLVASILLLLCITGITVIATKKGEVESMYVVTSGIRNIESFSLPDGTVVMMGPGSRLTYPANFTKDIREVHLNGQAFFDVAKDHIKPFIVHTDVMSVQALGTAFELFGYENENKTETILLEGKIKVTIADNDTGKDDMYILSPDEKLLLDKSSGQVRKQIVNADKYTAWRKKNILCFENEKLSMIIPRLEQWYGRSITCAKDISEKYRFTFMVRDESLERILYMMKASSPLEYFEEDDGNFVLTLK